MNINVLLDFVCIKARRNEFQYHEIVSVICTVRRDRSTSIDVAEIVTKGHRTQTNVNVF